MATYGAAGKNTYTIPNVVGFFSNEVNSNNGVTQVYIQGPALTQKTVGTYNPSTSKFTPSSDSGLTQQQLQVISGSTGINAIKSASVQTATKGIQATGVNLQTAQQKAQKLVSPNTAKSSPQQPQQGSSTPVTQPTKPESQTLEVLKYPLDMEDAQDRIRFSVWELVKSSLGSTLKLSNPDDNSSYRSKGINIILPIQAPISDQNAVTWGSGELNELQRGLAELSLSFMNDPQKTVDSAISEAQGKLTEQEQMKKLKGLGQLYFAEQALGVGGLMSRAAGMVLNPNLELLFQGPTLRSFQFQFKLSPRTKDEADVVKKIIKAFKKNMAVRKDENLFLKAPYVFQIEYMKGATRKHPSINLIKKCALQGFNVDYTPLGTYMTYSDDEATMVSYNLSMQFQEIVPIYDKDYDDHPIGY